jgi:hypothetical protein
MKSIITKKVVIIFTVVIVIVLSAILVAFATGNTKYPSLSDPNGVFYERLDADGNVIYSITNQELFEEIKSNDGVEQILLMVDSYLLQSYLDNLTDTQIQNKITELTYGTYDASELANLDDTTKASYEEAYAQSMMLAGYDGNEAAYASILLAREIYTRYIIDFNKEITDMNLAADYVTNYFNDIQAIRIRFTSSADAQDVMKHFNLLTLSTTTLVEYLGYIYTSETILDSNEQVAQAYTTVTPYYFDDSENIVNLSDTIVYTLGINGIYSDSNDNSYSIDNNGNLIDATSEVIVDNTKLFASKTEAETYKTANTVFFNVSKSNPFDKNEDAIVTNSLGQTVYTVDYAGRVLDLAHNDVTSTCGLIVNKVYTAIADVPAATENNSRALTDAEILQKYILMYNYVYGDYRDVLPTNATVTSLLASDNPYLTFNYAEVLATQTSLAAYMFKTLDLENATLKPFSASPKAYAGASDTNYYMVYKLNQVNKVDVYQIMLDYIEENINIPTEVAGNITLPTTGWYDSKIVWGSGNAAVLTSAGVVTPPAADTNVVLTYTITANSVTRVGSVIVKVLASGTTSTVTENTSSQVTFKTILNDPTLYSSLYQAMLDDKVYGTDADTNISDHMITLRNDYSFTIYDYYLALTYSQTDASFALNDKGSKDVLFSLSGKIGADDSAYQVSADDFMNYVLAKNASLYVLYASQLKELITSEYYTEVFGTQTEISKNKSDKMTEMYASVQSAKDYYSYLQKLYASYGITFTYNSFADYVYLQYGTKTESDLLKYFVQGALQPYMINEAINNYDLVDLLYPSVQEYYQNYFSLNVSHIVIYVDYNEDGSPDNYFDYYASLSDTQKDEFDALVAQFETVVDDFNGDFAALVLAYQNATRTDANWGVFKQAGINILTEELNQTDDSDVTHSVTYSGDYGVKDSYVSEYVQALVDLYHLYQQEQNSDLTELTSSLITTEFGFHIILVTQGDDFNQPSAINDTVDPSDPEYNATAEPTLEQCMQYAQYFFYSNVYDLTDANIEALYNITVPELPATVTAALKVYFDTQLQGLYVLGTINVTLADRLVDGTFMESIYTTKTNAELQSMLVNVKDVYYQALFADYLK